jgi:hypothetical protein
MPPGAITRTTPEGKPVALAGVAVVPVPVVVVVQPQQRDLYRRAGYPQGGIHHGHAPLRRVQDAIERLRPKRARCSVERAGIDLAVSPQLDAACSRLAHPRPAVSTREQLVAGLGAVDAPP